MIKTVGLVGCGTMGQGIAQVLSVKGYQVLINDQSGEIIDKAIASVQKRLAREVEKERLGAADAEAAFKRLGRAESVSDLSSCDLIIEAATENMQVKKAILRQVEAVVKPETILATNTSSLSITELGSEVSRPENVIGVHFFNPVPVMKLVEVIKGLSTSKEVEEKIFDFVASLDKTAVKVEEAPGFVVNRILIPMINEAVGIYADGVASVEDIDTAMRLGANHPMGPLALGDLVGLDVCLAIMDILHAEFGEDKYRAHPLLRKMVRGGKLGRKTKEGFYKY